MRECQWRTTIIIAYHIDMLCLRTSYTCEVIRREFEQRTAGMLSKNSITAPRELELRGSYPRWIASLRIIVIYYNNCICACENGT